MIFSVKTRCSLWKNDTMERKVNLGCGNNILDGWENYDYYPADARVQFIDLDVLPLPFEDDSVDYFFMEDVFEHLNVNRFLFMKDIHRALKKNGKIEIMVPANCRIITHTIGHFSPNYFNPILWENITDKWGPCLSFYFSLELFERYNWNNKTRLLFDLFPILYNMFPRMVHGGLRWILKKVS